MKIETRWARVEDFRAAGFKDRGTKRGLVLEVNDARAAVVSISLGPPGSPATACAWVGAAGRRAPKALHRFARQAMEAAAASGTRILLAVADRNIPRAGPWLLRLGFVPVTETEKGVLYRWQAKPSVRQSRQPAQLSAA